MKRIFDAIRQRREEYRQIREGLAAIRHDKIAAEVDLRRCFYHAASMKDPRGMAGALFADAKLEYYRYTTSSAFPGITPQMLLPRTLAVEETRANLEEEWIATQEDEWDYLQGLLPDFDAANMDKALLPTQPEHFQCYFVGDFLDAVDYCIGLDGLPLHAAVVGEGPVLLQTVKDLRRVPDYSHHFPPRPPRGGHRRRPSEPETRGADFLPVQLGLSV